MNLIWTQLLLSNEEVAVVMEITPECIYKHPGLESEVFSSRLSAEHVMSLDSFLPIKEPEKADTVG